MPDVPITQPSYYYVFNNYWICKQSRSASNRAQLFTMTANPEAADVQNHNRKTTE